MRRLLLMLAPLTAAGLLTLSGCGGPSTPSGAPTVSGKGGGAAGKTGSGKTEAAAVSGYAASLKGKVTYNGDDKPGPKMLTPSKDQDKCPKEVPAEGWYVNPESKALQYAVVFLKPPAGVKMPTKFGPNTEKPSAGKEVLEVAQPHCQFEPRVLIMHPGQKLRFINDSDPAIAHDTSVSGVTWKHGPETLPPNGKTKDLNPEPSDKNPYKVSCNIHTGSMSGYVWRPTHPWMAVTDKDGNFEIKDVPVLEGGKKMILAVWHEMLDTPDKTMEIGEVDVKPNEPATKDFAMPKK